MAVPDGHSARETRLAGEGAAAVVLVRADGPLAANRRVYAVLDALGWVPKDLPGLKKNLVPTLVSSDTIAHSCRLAYEQSTLTSAEPYATLFERELIRMYPAGVLTLPAPPGTNSCRRVH